MAANETQKVVLRFKNYTPVDPELLKLKVAENIKLTIETPLEKESQENESYLENITIDLESLAPKKITSDLEKDLAKKMHRLERRTEKIISELVRQRLAGNRRDDIVSAVNAFQSKNESSVSTF